VGSLTVQVGSYNVIEQANERVARLQAAGFSARVATIELPKRGTWYRVQAGRFSNREEAARYGNELKSKGAADSFIIADAAGGK
jgi:cell division protein FtsN